MSKGVWLVPTFLFEKLATMSMSISSLLWQPRASQTGIGDRLTAAANTEVERITSVDRSKRKRKRYAAYIDKLCKYTAENGNVAALKRYKSEHADLVESTVRSFSTL